jgi:hypothetical protein
MIDSENESKIYFPDDEEFVPYGGGQNASDVAGGFAEVKEDMMDDDEQKLIQNIKDEAFFSS